MGSTRRGLSRLLRHRATAVRLRLALTPPWAGAAGRCPSRGSWPNKHRLGLQRQHLPHLGATLPPSGDKENGVGTILITDKASKTFTILK